MKTLLDKVFRARPSRRTWLPASLTVLPVAIEEAAVSPPDRLAGIPVVELPGSHAGLLGEPDVQRRIVAFLHAPCH